MAEKTKFTTIDEYIEAQPEHVQDILRKMREVIKKTAPDAEERMSWQMPTFHFYENLVHFAAHKNHIGFYPAPSSIIAFEERLKEYKTSKGCIQFPYAKPIPYDLVEEITKFRVEEVLAKRK